MELRFEAEVFEWRGPAPHWFVALPADAAADVAELAPMLSYGWGVVPVTVRLGGSRWTTSLFPREGGYLLGLRTAERRREGVELGDTVAVAITLG